MSKFTLFHLILAVGGFAFAASLVVPKIKSVRPQSGVFTVLGQFQKDKSPAPIVTIVYSLLGILLIGSSTSIVLIAVSRGVTVSDMVRPETIWKFYGTALLILASLLWLVAS